MAICPECLKKIETLELVEEGVQVTPMTKDGEYDYDHTQFDSGIFPQSHWGCPRCMHPIAFDQEEAIAWLNRGDEQDDI